MEESWPMFRPNRWVVERFCSAGKMIQREISRALVLNLSGKAVLGTAQDIFVLDSAFALIEAHPLFVLCYQLGNPRCPTVKVL
jgi:hypothetical protein